MSTVNLIKPPKKRTYRDLFFFRRRPYWRGIGLDWEQPKTEEEFQKLLESEGFISNSFWQQDDINQYPIIAQDIRDLEQHLLPTFFEFNQKSRYYQNQFYLYQWIFIFGALLTTVVGILSAVATDDWGKSVLSMLTALVGAVTAFYTAMSNRGEPQKRWGRTRRLAEELRTLYFKYLAHLPPFDQADRAQKLREAVIDIRVRERENG
jgi:hypothetical protein